MDNGKKYDRGKTRYDLVPRDSYKAWADVLTFGAEKYGDDNWKKLDRLQDRYYAAAVRHIEAYRAGEATDEESGLPHLAHAITCLSFMLEDSYVRTMDVKPESRLEDSTPHGSSVLLWDLAGSYGSEFKKQFEAAFEKANREETRTKAK